MDEPHGPRRAAASAARMAYDDNPTTLTTREKYKRVAEHRRYPKKNRYNMEDLALGLVASDAGVNRYYAMHAGPVAKKALRYLAQAASAKKPEIKSKSVRLARKYFADISAERHPELTEQIEGRLLWEEGHRPETYGAEPSVNPKTGAQEFYGFRDVFNKVTGGLFDKERTATPPNATLSSSNGTISIPGNEMANQQLINSPAMGVRIPRETLILPTEKPEPPPLKSRNAVQANLPGRDADQFLDSNFANRVSKFQQYANEDGDTLRFSSAYRTPEFQATLRDDPNAITPAKNSLHSAGLAVDVEGFNSFPADKQQRIREAAQAAGLSWGGNFRKPDPVHFYYDPGDDRRSLITDFGEQIRRFHTKK